MKCISVYTDNFEAFSDIFEQIVTTEFAENEERELEESRLVIPVMYLSIIWSVCHKSQKWS